MTATVTPLAGGMKVALAVGTTAVGTTAGGIGSVVNPFGVAVWITDAICTVTDASDAAATMDIGIDDAGDTSSDTLLDGVDINTAASTHKITATGNASPEALLWPAGYYLVATKATGAANAEKNFAANLLLKILRTA